MNIMLIDLDSTIPNLALMKIAAYHRERGDSVSWNTNAPDKVYISCIFRKNAKKADSSAAMLRATYGDIEIEIGGPGYDLKKRLPMEIETISPDYSIYPDCEYSLGFTTRGCIRNCSFCIVPKKEGKLKKVSDIEKIHNPKHSAIKLLDNNVLAMPENFKHICDYCAKNNLKIDFSQGLDARLLTDELAAYLAKVKPLACFDFAFDSWDYEQDVIKTVELLKKHGINPRNKVMFYVYCSNDLDGPTGIKSAIRRCYKLRELGTNPYVMLNIDSEPSAIMKDLKRWANRKPIFWSTDFKNYNRKYKNYEWC